jgi:hypothetical protein
MEVRENRQERESARGRRKNIEKSLKITFLSSFIEIIFSATSKKRN